MNPAIAPLSADEAAEQIDQLAALLHACVHDGASIGFVMPFTVEQSEAYWRCKVLPRLRDGSLLLLAARGGEGLVGSVQLDHDMPANQTHRAEVRKLLVHPDRRRRGLGKALMEAVESRAAASGRSLLTLDTRSGDHAERLYAALGYRVAGIIPGYCRDPFEARLDATTVLYKTL